MATYVLAYSGGEGMANTPEAQAAAMAAWGAWFGSMGASVVDGGNPFGPASTVTGGKVTAGGASKLTGYSVITADGLDAAVALAKGCPVLASGGTVEVYETINMM
jgi:hypothetical protein